MKIGTDNSAVSSKFTGTSRYINCLIEQIKTTGHQLTTFSPAKQDSGKGLTAGLINFSRGGIKRHLYRQFSLAGEMEKERIECGIFPNYFMPVQFRKPSAIIIHDLSFITHPQFYSKPFVIYYTRQMKETLKQKPVIVTVSENSREQIHKHLGIRKEDIFLIQAYSNFHREMTGSNGAAAKRPYLLYVGHVEPRKNLQFLIENFLAWKNEKKIDISLIIAGEIWIKSSSIKLLLNKYMNHPDVKFTGYVKEEGLRELYSNAAGFVHTSFVEGFGLPVLEAMHYELPIICSSGTATEEISGPDSIRIDPYSNLSFRKGLDCLYSKIQANETVKYKIKYSPELTNYQLNTVLDIMERKVNSHVFSYQEAAINIEEAVEKTLLYASLFNSGLKRNNLLKSIFDVKTTEWKLQSVLNDLISKNKISAHNNTLYLNSGSKYSYKSERTNKKLNKSLLFLRILKAFPLISVISFSGGTAHYGLKHHDDIDLFIITKPNCLYPVYAVIHLLSFIFGLRKVICANYLIDENNLEIYSPKDFYTAHQIISLIPYKNEPGFNNFLSKNNWINYFFPNFEIKQSDYNLPSLLFAVFIPLNIAVMMFYKSLYKVKILSDKTESLKLTPFCLKLHTNDHRLRITSMFEREWEIYSENRNKSHIKPLKLVYENSKEAADLKEAKTKLKLRV